MVFLIQHKNESCIYWHVNHLSQKWGWKVRLELRSRLQIVPKEVTKNDGNNNLTTKIMILVSQPLDSLMGGSPARPQRLSLPCQWRTARPISAGTMIRRSVRTPLTPTGNLLWPSFWLSPYTPSIKARLFLSKMTNRSRRIVRRWGPMTACWGGAVSGCVYVYWRN